MLAELVKIEKKSIFINRLNLIKKKKEKRDRKKEERETQTEEDREIVRKSERETRR